MRVIQERSSGNGPLVSYTRGNDLSGSMEGAGGIGGLLARSHGHSGGNWSTHSYYQADGNGNITFMLNSSQAMVARYRYDPFGNTILMTGTLAGQNVYRFSSKQFHNVSGLYYYGYRWYDPTVQRWINRDPIMELGGMNLYGFVSNDPVGIVDAFGLADRPPGRPPVFPPIYWPPKVGGNCDSGQRKLCEEECASRGKVLTECRHQQSDTLIKRRVYDLGIGWHIEEQWLHQEWLECDCTDPRTLPPPEPPCTKRNWPPPLPPA